MQIPENIKITDATGKTVAFLSPKSDGLKDVYPDIRLNGESTLEFSLPANSEKIDYITPESLIWVGNRVYSLLKDDAMETIRDEENKLRIKFMPVERWNELDTSYVEPSLSNDPTIASPADLAVIIVGGGTNLSGGTYTTGTASHALYAVLQGSGWTMGTVDVQGVHDLQNEKVSRLQLIKQIQEIWGGYVVWDSVNKVVHLRDEQAWKNYSGFQVKYKKNLKHITRTQSNKLVTKLYCFGKDDLDIATVNGGLKYVTNNTYTPKEYVDIYRNPDIDSPQELKDKATLELAAICKPRYLYRVKILDLRTLPEYSHEEFSLGDMVDIIDPDVAPNSPKHRLIRHRYNFFQPWDCELEIGDQEERIIDKLKSSFNTTGFINETFNYKGKLSGQTLVDGTVINAKIANAAIDATKFNTKQVILMDDLWGNNTPSTGLVAWNPHRLFFNGVEYPIASGNTNKKYIVWRKSINQGAYQFYTDTEFASVTLADTDFVIAVNNKGIHDIAWYNRLAREFIGSAFIADAAIKSAHIQDAAITNAKIANATIESAKIKDLIADKVKTGILKSTDESTWINMDNGEFNFKDALKWVNNQLVISGIDSGSKVFNSTPTPPYKLNDLWKVTGIAGVDFRICTTARVSGAYVANDWTNITDSKTYTDAIKNLTTGTAISGGITTIDNTKVKVAHSGLGGQYSEMRADGFVRKWQYGEAKYLNDIWIGQFDEQGTDFGASRPAPWKIYLPVRFRGRINTKVIVIPTTLNMNKGKMSIEFRNRVEELITYHQIRCQVSRPRGTTDYVMDLNANPPWVEINAFERLEWSDGKFNEYVKYGGLDYIVIAIGE